MNFFSRAGRAILESAWTLFGLVASSFVIGIGLVVAVGADNVQNALDGTWLLASLVLSALIYIIAVAIVLLPLFIRKWSKDNIKKLLGIDTKPRLKPMLLAIPLWVPYFLVSALLIVGLKALTPSFNADQAQDIGFSHLTGLWQYIGAFIALVILPPIAEETLFRGYLFGKLRGRNGFLVSALITSAIFGLVHMQLNVGIDVFVLSMVLCVLREKTGSIWAGMVLHATKNAAAYFLLFILPLIDPASKLLQ